MMKHIVNIAAFLLANTAGYLTIPVCYVLGIQGGAISAQNPGFSAEALKTQFFHGMFVTWLVCALFSLAFFFLKGKIRFLFLLAPVAVTMAYGLSVLAGFLSST